MSKLKSMNVIVGCVYYKVINQFLETLEKEKKQMDVVELVYLSFKLLGKTKDEIVKVPKGKTLAYAYDKMLKQLKKKLEKFYTEKDSYIEYILGVGYKDF
jgi:hypothetical protein